MLEDSATMKRTLDSDCSVSVPSLSLWSLSSSFARKQSESVNMERNNLNTLLNESKLYVRFAVYAMTVNSMSIYRFPEQVYKYGGSIIITYIIIMVLMIQPIVYSELLLGQLYFRKLSARSTRVLFGKIAPAIKITSAILALLFIPNQSIYQHFGNLLLDFNKSSTQLLWCSCNSISQFHDNASSNGGGNPTFCIETNNFPDTNPIVELASLNISDTSNDRHRTVVTTPEAAPSLFLREQVLNVMPMNFQREVTIWETINWKLILIAFAFNSIILYFTFENKFSQCFLKLLLWIAMIFPVLLFVLLISELNASGRVAMMMQLIYFDWRDFARIEVWYEAVHLAIISTCVGLGLITTVSSSTRMSYKRYYNLSWKFVIFCISTVLLSSLVVLAQIELITVLFRSTYTKDIISKTPGIATVLFASIFCYPSSSLLMRSLYGIFYVMKILSFCYFQVLAVESISQTFSNNTSKILNSDRRTVRFLIKAAILILMQMITVPFAFQGTEKLLKTAFAFDGLLPILLLLGIKVGHMSGFKSVNTFEEDLYLTYRLKLSKVFKFQTRYFWTFSFIVVSASLLLIKGGSWLFQLYERRNLLCWCGNWQFHYGLCLNLLPVLIFLVVTIWQICLDWRKSLKRNRTKGRYLRTAQDPLQKWRHEIRSNSYPNSELSGRSTATVDSSRLRNPSRFTTLDYSSFDLDENGSTQSVVATPPLVTPTKASTVDSTKQKMDQKHLRTSLEYLDLQPKISRMSATKRGSTKRKSTGQRVVRQIRRRRLPLPLEWSPGGLGDFSLYNVHHNGKPPGPDNNDNVNAHTQFLLPTFSTPLAEADDSILDFDLPPPPKFLLQECDDGLDNPLHETSVQDAYACGNSLENISAGDGECQEIISVLEELDGALGEPQSGEGEASTRSSTVSPTINFNVTDLVTSRVANELNISFGSASSLSEEDLNGSFVSAEFMDGSSACHSFLFTNENQL